MKKKTNHTKVTGHAFYKSDADSAAHANAINLTSDTLPNAVLTLGAFGFIDDDKPAYAKKGYVNLETNLIQSPSDSGDAIIRISFTADSSVNNGGVVCGLRINGNVIVSNTQTTARRTLGAQRFTFTFPVWFSGSSFTHGIEPFVHFDNTGTETLDIWSQSITVHQYSN